MKTPVMSGEIEPRCRKVERKDKVSVTWGPNCATKGPVNGNGQKDCSPLN